MGRLEGIKNFFTVNYNSVAEKTGKLKSDVNARVDAFAKAHPYVYNSAKGVAALAVIAFLASPVLFPNTAAAKFVDRNVRVIVAGAVGYALGIVASLSGHKLSDKDSYKIYKVVLAVVLLAAVITHFNPISRMFAVGAVLGYNNVLQLPLHRIGIGAAPVPAEKPAANPDAGDAKAGDGKVKA